MSLAAILLTFAVLAGTASANPKVKYNDCVRFEPSQEVAQQLKFYNKEPVGRVVEFYAAGSRYASAAYLIQIQVTEHLIEQLVVAERNLTQIECE